MSPTTDLDLTEIPPVWRGDWQSDYDGLFEARPFVKQDADGFYGGLEVSRGGGEPMVSMDHEPHQTFIAARDAAEERACVWLDGGEDTP